MALSAPALYRLFYRSRQTAPVAADVEAAVHRIMEASVPNNRAVGVTGILVVAWGYFIQALEGEIDAVRSVYARISMDPRHSDPHIISQSPVERRLFGDWNMCARSLAASDAAILAVLDAKSAFNPQALTAESAQRLLTTIAEIQRRSASSHRVG